MTQTTTQPSSPSQPTTYEPPALIEYGSLHTLIRGAGSQRIDEGECAVSGNEPDVFGDCD